MTHPFASEHYQKLAQDARALVRQWVTESQSIKPTYAAKQLAQRVCPLPLDLSMASFALRTTTFRVVTYLVFLV